jgi:hypothetical protein
LRQFYSYQSRLDDRERIVSTLAHLDEYLISGHSSLNQWGGPDEQYYLVPMAYLEQGLPALGRWAGDVHKVIRDEVPEYMGKFMATGNLTRGTKEKKGAIQELEARLKSLDEIEDSLRARLSR